MNPNAQTHVSIAHSIMAAAERRAANLQALREPGAGQFSPRTLSSVREADDYLWSVASPRARLVESYFERGWRRTNEALRDGKYPEVAEALDAAMRPLPDGLVLRRLMTPRTFGDPAVVAAKGQLLRDSAYFPGTLDTPDAPRPTGWMALRVAVPAGIGAYVHPDKRLVLLERCTPIVVTRAVRTPAGWNVYGVVRPGEHRVAEAQAAAQQARAEYAAAVRAAA